MRGREERELPVAGAGRRAEDRLRRPGQLGGTAAVFELAVRRRRHRRGLEELEARNVRRRRRPTRASSRSIEDALKNEFFTPPDPTFSLFNYNFDTDPARQVAFGKLYDTWPDARLSAYRANGGKLLLWNGMSDPIFSANETIEYYERLVASNGGLRKAGEFARLFLVPGMNHCSTGPATDTYDSLTKLIDWVENDNAPERIVASGAIVPGPHPAAVPVSQLRAVQRPGKS